MPPTSPSAILPLKAPKPTAFTASKAIPKSFPQINSING